MKYIMLVFLLIVSIQVSTTQFPTVCMESESLGARECCPLFDGSKCGKEDGRGDCQTISLPNKSPNGDVRAAWPYYFDKVCICDDNFFGYDCGRCKYGHYGESCSYSKVIERKSIYDYTQQEWEEYLEILANSKRHSSDYSVFLNESQTPSEIANPSILPMSPIKLYDLFAWQHHYSAKDSELKKDYAHESTGFPTWHRQFLLWFEWEIQYMLKSMGKEDYYTFRIPYWDWRKEKQTESNSLFQPNRLGKTVNNNGVPHINSEILRSWETICWQKEAKTYYICNPQVLTGPLQRCPLEESCDSENELWPSDNDVEAVLSATMYDTPPYNKMATNSFRNQLEGFQPLSKNDSLYCRENKLCMCDDNEDPSKSDYNCTEDEKGTPIQRLLHNSIHIILGLGYFGATNTNTKGVMGDVAASANDPIFINHHAMVDCIFETWLQKNPGAEYPDDDSSIPKGHRKDDYIVPFFPLYKHGDMFATADNFGYKCIFKSPQSNKSPSCGKKIAIAAVVPGIICVILGIICVIIFCVCCFLISKICKQKKETTTESADHATSEERYSLMGNDS